MGHKGDKIVPDVLVYIFTKDTCKYILKIKESYYSKR